MSTPAVDRPPLPPVARRLWKAFGLMVVLILTFVIANRVLSTDRSLGAGDLGHDFLAFYTAGTFAGRGDYAGMYDLEAVRAFQVAMAPQIGMELGNGFMPWWNPPFAALAVEPLAKLPYGTALAIWLTFNAACVAAACALLAGVVRKVRIEDRGSRIANTGLCDPLSSIFYSRFSTWALVPALVFVSMPFLLSMTHAQNTGLSLLMLTGVAVLWRAKRAFAAGVVCGLMFYKPQLGALVAVALTVRLGWRAAAGVACTGVVLLLLTLAAMPGAFGVFVSKMPANLTWFQEAIPYYWERHVTFKAFWRLLIQGHDRGPTAGIVVALWAVCATGLGVALLTVLWRRSAGEDRAIAATVACSPLLMPFYFDYDLLLMAVPVVLYAADRLANGARGIDRWTTTGWATLAGYMILHPHVADATNVNGNAVVMAWCAAVTIARAWARHAEVVKTVPSIEPARLAA